ncbi:MAG: hypothetical protein K6A05_06260 [Lachnospiraceae bacterium]|nr:hypothetical protein [Lachnospiraceae bacterium]
MLKFVGKSACHSYKCLTDVEPVETAEVENESTPVATPEERNIIEYNSGYNLFVVVAVVVVVLVVMTVVLCVVLVMLHKTKG